MGEERGVATTGAQVVSPMIIVTVTKLILKASTRQQFWKKM